MSDVAFSIEGRADIPPEIAPWVAAHADVLAEDWFFTEFATAHADDAGAF